MLCTVLVPQIRSAGDKGWGVFAEEDISAGTYLVQYCGEVVGSKEAERRQTQYKEQVGV